MPRASKLSPADQTKLCAEYIAGEPSTALAKRYGLWSNQVVIILRRHDVPVRPRGQRPRVHTALGEPVVYPGFPKKLPCLRCGRVRKSRHRGDRCCARCNQHNQDIPPGHRILLGGVPGEAEDAA